MKKILALLAAVLLVISVAACNPAVAVLTLDNDEYQIVEVEYEVIGKETKTAPNGFSIVIPSRRHITKYYLILKNDNGEITKLVNASEYYEYEAGDIYIVETKEKVTNKH